MRVNNNLDLPLTSLEMAVICQIAEPPYMPEYDDPIAAIRYEIQWALDWHDFDKAAELRRQEKQLLAQRAVILHRMIIEIIESSAVMNRVASNLVRDISPNAGQDEPTQLDRCELFSALLTLPIRSRQAVMLRYYYDLSEDQIVTTMRLSRGAVMAHIARGMQCLQHIIRI